MRAVLLLIFFCFIIKSYGQRITNDKGKSFYIDKVCKILSNDPDCLNSEIPFEIRANKKDTIKYIADKEYLFFKGKCDTTCYFDTTELYFTDRSLYKIDSTEELFYIVGISKALKIFDEPNLCSLSDTSSIFLRFSFFRDSLPLIYRLDKQSNNITLHTKICNGKFIFPDSIVINNSSPIDSHDWEHLYNDFLVLKNWKPKEKFILLMPDLLIEMKKGKDYSYIYLNHDELTLTRDIRKVLRRIENKLNKCTIHKAAYK
jgi:hypothetical protein